MTATQREGLSDAALALTQPVIDELLKDIARRIKDAGAITDTAEYQIYRAQALGESKQAIKAAVARQIKAQDKVIDSLFDYILDNSTPLTANGSLKQIAEGYAKMSRQKTAEQLKNLWADTPQGLREGAGLCLPPDRDGRAGHGDRHPPRLRAAGQARPAHH